MASTKPIISFNDDVGGQIDEKRYTQQFFVNTRGLYNHSVDPFARTNVVSDGRRHRQHVFPEMDTVAPAEVQVRCCNTPAEPVVRGKREEAPLEEATMLWTELQTQRPARRRFTTATIGLDQTENN
jgi:hypothetical protein